MEIESSGHTRKAMKQQVIRAQTRVADMSQDQPGCRWRVMYLKEGVEHKSPWFRSQSRVQRARDVLQARYGRTVIIMD